MCIVQQSWKYSLYLWSPPETLLKAEIKKAGQIRVSQPAAAFAQAQCISAGRVLLLSDAGSPTNFFHVPCYFFLTLFLLFNSQTRTISYADVEHPKEPVSLFGSLGSHACFCWMVEAVGGRVQEGLLKLVITSKTSIAGAFGCGLQLGFQVQSHHCLHQGKHYPGCRLPSPALSVQQMSRINTQITSDPFSAGLVASLCLPCPRSKIGWLALSRQNVLGSTGGKALHSCPKG